MNEKRYSIVRVEGCNEERLKLCPNMPTCAFCLYGDTKQQMINKVAQVMRRNHLGWCNIERISQEIVEFLGVE